MRNATGAANINVKMVLSIQMMIMSVKVIGISVDSIQGIDAEKKRIEDIDTTATTNLEIIGADVINKAGKNISAISTDMAFAVSKGSGILSAKVKG